METKKKFDILSKDYNEKLRELTDISKKIGVMLREYYTSEKLKSFSSFDEFLEDINFLCENGGLGKLLFIKEVEEIYFK